jgi:hypothetical protein
MKQPKKCFSGSDTFARKKNGFFVTSEKSTSPFIPLVKNKVSIFSLPGPEK